MHKPKERPGAASPGPTYMTSQQMASFLQDLRTNRPARPNGSRPPPTHFNTWSSRTGTGATDSRPLSPFQPTVAVEARPQTAAENRRHPHQRTNSSMSIDEVLVGRPLVQQPRGRNMSSSMSTRDRTPSIQYRENDQRQIEREEARALRIAMEELEFKEENSLYSAARDEAAELVWKHRNPDAPGANPDAPYAYPGPEDKSGHQRSRSLGRGEQDLQRSNSKLRKRNSMGSSVSGSRSSSLQSRRVPSGSSVTANADFGTSPTKDSFGITSDALAKLPKTSANPSDANHRRRSTSGRRKASGSLFKNPDDQIYEEPEEDAQAAAPPKVSVPAVAEAPTPAKLPLQVRRNPFSRVQFARDHSLVRSSTDPIIGSKRFDRFEIQRNPPSQTHNAAYTSNQPETLAKVGLKAGAENEPEVQMKDGKEIRGDDIRAATSMRLRDRSPKLPTPTIVSDSPGRPIVSFTNNLKPKEIELKEEVSAVPEPSPKTAVPAESAPPPLTKASTVPVVPTVNHPSVSSKRSMFSSPSPFKAPPSTRVGRANTPAINIYEDPPARPLSNASTTRKVNPSHSPTPPLPTINVSQALPPRAKPSTTAPIPTISVQETPSISVSPASRGPSVKAPSISVTPVPTISINESSSRPEPRTKTPSISVTPIVPSISVDGPSVPSINVSGPVVPSIKVNGPPVPSINVNEPAASTRPLPNPKNHSSRSVPRNNTTSHWSPAAAVRTGALCTQCALPIAGRIVSAAGSRFHPECFACHHCGEHLECVAFYPEPENKYAERIARIQARIRGEDIEYLPSHPTPSDMMRLEEEDGDESMRFFCHLDFHELYSPRCKSCKTPIEGEVIVACGAEWHVGHFFCAQCGDPFDSSTPFVEKEGYAWCVGCHTNRFSTKCKKCRRPVTDTVVKALGQEWHAGCFVCAECEGPFTDGRYFLRGESQDPVCVRCEERRLKA